MTFTEILTALNAGIAADPELTVWATSTYGHAHKVVTMVDERNPPVETDYPMVHLYQVARAGEMDVGGDTYTVGCVVGIHDDAAAAGAIWQDTSMLYPGVERLDRMTRMVLSAAMTATGGLEDLFVRFARVEYETVEFFPYFLADIELILDRPVEFGA